MMMIATIIQVLVLTSCSDALTEYANCWMPEATDAIPPYSPSDWANVSCICV